MTLRTPHALLSPRDVLGICAEDARRLGVAEGAMVRVRSRYGAAVLAARVDPAVRPGELFATFHTAQAFVNRVTGPHRDGRTGTPEYKLAAVAVEPLAPG
jgi:predicted molibdopterin-dependent oxidoreductase YjgC